MLDHYSADYCLVLLRQRERQQWLERLWQFLQLQYQFLLLTLQMQCLRELIPEAFFCFGDKG